ncbi:MAG: M1 family aminopeptidase [Acidobacteriota bacterium]|nr:M1 family aminopeptidase [Acidobacteriota bacterium]
MRRMRTMPASPVRGILRALALSALIISTVSPLLAMTSETAVISSTAQGAALAVASATVATSSTAQGAASPYDVLWDRLSRAFEAGDLDGYTDAFVSELRTSERRRADELRSVFGMKSALFRVAGRTADPAGPERVFLQVFFQNDLSARLENWQVVPAWRDGAWRIAEKTISGGVGTLYKLRLPAGPAVRAGRVEVVHQDFRLTFTDAFVFHDNLPDLETGLIILGEGRLRFTPSSATERRQLEIRYGTPFLEDTVESAYLRFSSGYFQSRIRIEGERPLDLPPDEAEALAGRAAALFRARYGASFTVENSLTGEPMTFLPQDEQAVFELRTRRTGALTYVYSPFSEDEVHLASRDPDRIISLYSPDSDGGPLKRMFVSFDQRVDVLDYRIDVDFQPEKLYLSARARVTFVARTEAADSLRFNLHPSLDILRIQDPSGRSLFFTQDRSRGLLYVFLTVPPAKGEESWIEVLYRGVLIPPPTAVDDLAAGQVGESISSNIPRYETFLYSYSAYWYPSPAEDDFFRAGLRVVVPPGYSCVASGLAVEKGVLNNLGRVTALEKVGHPIFGFESRAPIRYLSFLVGRLAPIGNGAGTAESVPIEAFYASDIRLPRWTLPEESRSIIRSFSDWFGPFPFEKLTVVQRQWPVGGGNSPASLVVLNELPRAADGTRLLEARTPVSLGRFRVGYLAHEIAHQWWGQGVSWATYRDQWLSEGLSQFAAILYLRDKMGEGVYRGQLKQFARWTAKKSRFGPVTLGTRLRHLDFAAYQAIVYDKSAVVLGMLLDLVGEERFIRGLRGFFERNRGRAVRTSDFVQAMGQAAERDLKPFFDRWLESHLLPEVRVAHSILTTGDTPVLRFHVTQTGPDFVFPLWVSWIENGRRVRRHLDVAAASQTIDVPCAGRPSRIAIDPDGIFPGRIR